MDGKWIPVEERLPEDDGMYLIYGERIIPKIYVGWYKSGRFEDDREHCISHLVEAWMPLPEPYRKEQSDGQD